MMKRATSAVWQTVQLVLALGVVCAAGWWGWQARPVMVEQTRDIRFQYDVENALNQGKAVLTRAAKLGAVEEKNVSYGKLFRGYMAYYAEQAGQLEDRPAADLDYPPLRLAVMSVWVKSVVAEHGMEVRYSDEIVGPLVRLNTALSIIASVAAGMLVLKVRRESGSTWGTSELLGSITAAGLWLSPALMLNTHAWPQWDVWVVCGVLVSLCLARWGWWSLAGFALVLFAMFKGQLLLMAIPMVVWPLVMMRIGAVVRLVLGGMIAGAMVTGPWLVKDAEGWVWIGAIGAGVSMACFAARSRMVLMAVAVLTTGAFVAPALLKNWPIDAMGLAAVALGLLIMAVLVKKLGKATVVLGAMAIAVGYCGWRLEGSMDWMKVGFPTKKYMAMNMGPVANVPTLLHDGWGWQIDDVVTALPSWVTDRTGEVSVRQLLHKATLGVLVIAGVAMGVQHARRSARFLAAAALPMVAAYALLPQMHERYALYAAGATVLMLGCGLGGWMLYLGWTALAGAMMLLSMMSVYGFPESWAWWSKVLGPLYPGWSQGQQMFSAGSWASVVMAVCVAVMAVTGRRGKVIEKA
jgi:hypothetical protein